MPLQVPKELVTRLQNVVTKEGKILELVLMDLVSAVFVSDIFLYFSNHFFVSVTVIQGCGKTATENNTYFSSTVGYSSPCVFTICRIKEGICQIRLDFDTFVLTQPESSTTPKVTNCIDARFSATSQGASIPVLCGTNTGKHSMISLKRN